MTSPDPRLVEARRQRAERQWVRAEFALRRAYGIAARHQQKLRHLANRADQRETDQ